jgi:ribonuclease Z
MTAARELTVLGTGSQVPTRRRNHNGYFLRWDGEGILFDPGEGTQRQMVHAGIGASDINRIVITHFHGDHCLGLPGVIARLSLDRVQHPVTAVYPASGQEFFDRLHYASSFYETAELVPLPVAEDGVFATAGAGSVAAGSVAAGPVALSSVASGSVASGSWEARRLDHPVDAYGYRFVEPDGVRMLPERLAALGVQGADIGRLQRAGSLTVRDERVIHLDEVSELRAGQRFAFVMDTRLCDAVYALADGVDMLVIESTYLAEHAEHAAAYGHMTAAQAAQVAAECGVRRLVLTHFSQRYDDPSAFATEAAAQFDGEIVVAEDLMRIDVPPRR